MENSTQRDLEAIWHPFTQIKHAVPPITIIKGEGVYLFDEKGNKYIDAFSSWWVNVHGHSHPYIAQKTYEQMQQLEHAVFSGFTHEPAIILAERLLNRLPDNQNKIFYSDNGSTSVEVALKMALQYWHNQGLNKTKFIAFRNSYHGDTFGGMSVAARNAFNNAFSKLLFDVIHIDLPVDDSKELALTQLKTALQRDDVAAFIFEPLVLGAGGMEMYEPSALDEMISLCRKHHCITIADEVMTGFGRTGKFFACDYVDNKPDIFCLSKGLTGGFMPLGATSCSQFIYDAFLSDDKMKTFFHGHSYTGNTMACAAANASMDIFDKLETFENIQRVADRFKKLYEDFKGHPSLIDIRHLGTILAMEVKTKESTSYLNMLAEDISSFFVEQGIIIRPLGNILYLLPPYCISDKDIAHIASSIKLFLDRVHKGESL